LVRADIARGLFAADVLLSRLQGQHPATLAPAIDGLPSDTSRHAAHELLAASENPQVRTAKGHRAAQRLSLGHNDVGAVIAWPLQQA
jgi:hypothetical protein